MSEDKMIRPDQIERRDAATNVALGIAAYAALKPQVDKVVGSAIDKVTGQKPESPIVMPPGTQRPNKD